MSSIDAASIIQLLKYYSQGYKFPPIVTEVLMDVAKREIEDRNKVVMIKRDPNIERDRLQAAYVKIVQGNTIEIHPCSIKGFGADFDGDQMAIFVPVSEQAQMEAKKKLIATTTSTTINDPIFELSKEMLAGIFTLTYEDKNNPVKVVSTIQEVRQLHIGTRVKFNFRGKQITSTAGRIIFNDNLPAYIEFVDYPVAKKELKGILSKIIAKSKSDFAITIDQLMKLSFFYCTLYPKTLSLDMMMLNKELEGLRRQLSQEKNTSKQQDIITKMESVLLEYIKKDAPDLYVMVKSGASRGVEQLRQVMVSKGIVSDIEGNLLPPITKAMNDGYTPEEYFEMSAASRKGVADRAINTGKGGYAYRKMVYAIGNVQAGLDIGNCGTKRGLKIKITPEFYKRMPGRYIIGKNNIEPLTEKHIGKTVELRSPVFCATEHICRTCYGDLIYQIGTKNIGIIAAQQVGSLSERIMKCSDGLIYYKGKWENFDQVWDKIPAKTILKDGVETKVCNEETLGANGFVTFKSIQRHKPSTDVVLITLKNGSTILCQANHPLIINEDVTVEAHEIIPWVDEILVDETYMSQELSEDVINQTKRDFSCIVNGFGKVVNDTFGLHYEVKTKNYYLTQRLRLHAARLHMNFSMHANIEVDNTVSFLCYVFPCKDSHVQFTGEGIDTDTLPMYSESNPSRGLQKVIRVETIPWTGWLYDIKTNTQEYLLLGVQNHNSFHLGGSVQLVKTNIKKEIMLTTDDAYLKQVENYCKIDDQTVTCTTGHGMIIIDQNSFVNEYKIKDEGDHFYLTSGFMNMYLENVEVLLTINQPTKVYKTESIDIKENRYIQITYTNGQRMFECIPEVFDFSNLASKIDSLVSGKGPWTSIESLYLKLYKFLSPVGDWDSTHLEVVMSNILRWKNDPKIPARLKTPYQPKIHSIKKLPGLISWPLGLAFENFSAAIATGMVSERAPESSIEKVVFGEPLSELGEKARKVKK